MKKINRFLAGAVILGMMLSFSACGDDNKDNKKSEPVSKSSAEEINNAYSDKLPDLKKDEYEKLSDGSNPIVDEFTQTDFLFTEQTMSTDSAGFENAFNVPKNGYAFMTSSGASVGYLGSEGIFYEGAYKDAKGHGFLNTRDEIVAAYKINETNIHLSASGNVVFGYASADGVAFSALSSADASAAYALVTAGSNPAESLGYHTVAVLELGADANGMLSEYKIYHCSVESEQAKHDH